eukprot:COSAG01_NODE_13731_length_1543_cov_1.039474_1_plen_437_part_01
MIEPAWTDLQAALALSPNDSALLALQQDLSAKRAAHARQRDAAAATGPSGLGGGSKRGAGGRTAPVSTCDARRPHTRPRSLVCCACRGAGRSSRTAPALCLPTEPAAGGVLGAAQVGPSAKPAQHSSVASAGAGARPAVGAAAGAGRNSGGGKVEDLAASAGGGGGALSAEHVLKRLTLDSPEQFGQILELAVLRKMKRLGLQDMIEIMATDDRVPGGLPEALAAARGDLRESSPDEYKAFVFSFMQIEMKLLPSSQVSPHPVRRADGLANDRVSCLHGTHHDAMPVWRIQRPCCLAGRRCGRPQLQAASARVRVSEVVDGLNQLADRLAGGCSLLIANPACCATPSLVHIRGGAGTTPQPELTCVCVCVCRWTAGEAFSMDEYDLAVVEGFKTLVRIGPAMTRLHCAASRDSIAGVQQILDSGGDADLEATTESGY